MSDRPDLFDDLLDEQLSQLPLEPLPDGFIQRTMLDIRPNPEPFRLVRFTDIVAALAFAVVGMVAFGFWVWMGRGFPLPEIEAAAVAGGGLWLQILLSLLVGAIVVFWQLWFGLRRRTSVRTTA